MALTGKQYAFVAAYLGDARFNATEAARRAGYATPMQEGWRLLRKAEIQAAIQSWRDETKAIAIANLEYRVRQLDDMERRYADLIAARAADMAGEAAGGETGLLVRQHKVVGVGPMAEAVTEYVADTAVTKERRELHKQAAQELGQWREKHEHTGEDGAPLLIVIGDRRDGPQ